MKKNFVIATLIVIGLMLAVMMSIVPSMAAPQERPLYQATPTSAPQEVSKGYSFNQGEGPGLSDEIAEIGSWYAKIRIDWSEVEPEANGEYTWPEDLQDDLDELTSADTEAIMVITRPPSAYLQAGSGCRPIGNMYLDEAADFAAAAAAHYDEVNHYILFEWIDRDPGDYNYFYGDITCYEGYRARYVNLFEGMYDAIKAENLDAKVYIGQIEWDDCDNPFDPSEGTCDGKNFLNYMLLNIEDYDGFTFEAWYKLDSYYPDTLNDFDDIDNLLEWVDGKADHYDTSYIPSEFAPYWQGQYWYCEDDDYDDDKAAVIEYMHNACGGSSYCDAWIYHQLPYSEYQNYGSCVELLEDDMTHTDAYDMFKSRPEPGGQSGK